MKSKETFITPQMEMLEFHKTDIVSTSDPGGSGNGSGGGIELPDCEL